MIFVADVGNIEEGLGHLFDSQTRVQRASADVVSLDGLFELGNKVLRVD